MKGLLALVAALGAVASAQEYEVLLSNDTDDHVGLNDAARASGRYMGTATEYLNVAAQTADTFYVDELKNPKQWGAVTSANLMKAMYLQPTQGNFTYEKADEFVRFAKHQGYKVRCHTLVWYYENPTWMSKGNWTKDELKNILTDHITNVISHFGDDCYSWDVVNEATAHDVNTAAYRTNFWFNTIGPEYVAHAFTVANQVKAKLGLKVKLYYNDYFIEYGGTPKATFAYNLVKGLLDQGVKVDGVGMQNHFFVGQVPSKDTLISVMKSYTDLGLDVASTELDLPILMPPSMAMQQQQVQDYNTIVGACKAVEKCVGVTLWDFVDTYSWIPGVYTGYGSANPWYQKNSTGPLIRKGGYDGIVAAWGIPLYGRCGGSGWNGPTNCAEGKCTVKNSFYSQCLN